MLRRGVEGAGGAKLERDFVCGVEGVGGRGVVCVVERPGRCAGGHDTRAGGGLSEIRKMRKRRCRSRRAEGEEAHGNRGQK